MKTPAFCVYREVKETKGENRKSGCCESYPSALQPESAEAAQERCLGCPYASHGFVCWHDDENCIRTEMRKITGNKKEEKNENCAQ